MIDQSFENSLNANLNKNILKDYEDYGRYMTYDEHTETDEDPIQLNIDYYTIKEKYNSLKFLFTSTFVYLMPSINDFNYLHIDYFDYIDQMFIKKFNISLYFILNIDRYDVVEDTMKLKILSFLKYLHFDIPQLSDPKQLLSDEYNEMYSDIFNNIDSDTLLKIYKTFHNLLTV